MAVSVKKRLFGIDGREVTFARRGFLTTNPDAVMALEKVGASFVAGYHAGLSARNPAELDKALAAVDPAHQGFAYEGAGMALALLDRLTPWNRVRLKNFLKGPGEPHTYMVIIGAGWAWARLGSPIARLAKALDPLLGWLAFDGYGFHEGYFHADTCVTQQKRPRGIDGYAGRVFDAGLGRSLWFVCGAEPEAVAKTIADFAPARQPDLWAGAGLACAYAGGASEPTYKTLRALSKPYWGNLAQGAAFAAKARLRSGIPSGPTTLAVECLTQVPCAAAARLCDEEMPAEASMANELANEPAFELWRKRIKSKFEEMLAEPGLLESAS